MDNDEINTPVCFVLGAGFTRAFNKTAPLMNIDGNDLDISSLISKYKEFENIQKILKSATLSSKKTKIDIEFLLSRLSISLPYDSLFLKKEERQLLFNDISNKFLNRINKIQIDNELEKKECLEKFANYIIKNKLSCITLNYDTLLDEALFNIEKIYDVEQIYHVDNYFNPDGSYGFFCRDESSIIQDTAIFKDRSDTLLLKLHGSVNWNIKKGYKKPYPLDAFIHSEKWYKPPSAQREVSSNDRSVHLEESPFIIPPVLIKTALNEEPIINIVWSEAYKKLVEAKTIIFIGYSLPKTDIATSFLLKETISSSKEKNIIVVNTRSKKSKIINKESPYKELFVQNKIEFCYDGAIEWIKKYLSTTKNVK
ncbi:hypothetical protein BH09PAT2_BH09PAT2_05780 [soil metagenome]